MLDLIRVASDDGASESDVIRDGLETVLIVEA
jgi:hypothetical protein